MPNSKTSLPATSYHLPATSYQPNTLLPTEKIIQIAKEGGVDFGPGDPKERIRYFVKLGILPHAVRKTPQDSGSQLQSQPVGLPAKALAPAGHLPYWSVERLKQIDKLFKRGNSYPAIAQKIKRVEKRQKEQEKKTSASNFQAIESKNPIVKRIPGIFLFSRVGSGNASSQKVDEEKIRALVNQELAKTIQYTQGIPSSPVIFGAKLMAATITTAGIALVGFYGAHKLASFQFDRQGNQELSAKSQNNLTNVLAATSDKHRLYIDADTEVAGTTLFLENITAPNIIYSVNEGTGIDITTGQNPTISLEDGAFVESLNDTAGVLTIAGSGGTTVSTSGSTITIKSTAGITSEADTLSTVTGRGATTSTASTFSGGLTVGGNLSLSDTNSTINITNTGTLAFKDGTNTLLSIIDQGAYATLRLSDKGSTGDPATCTVGDIYFNDTDNAFKGCTTANTWEQLDNAAGGGFTSFDVSGDSGTDQTITDGNILEIAGGTNGIDTVGTATDTVTINLDTTEISDATFGSGSGFTWTFNAGATDPTLAFATNQITIGGAATLTATDVTDFDCTDCIDFDDISDSPTLDATTDINLSTLDLYVDLTSSGVFSIRDVATAFWTFDDDSTVDVVFPAAGTIGIDASATANTTTGGVIDLNVTSATSNNRGLDISYTSSSTGNMTQYGFYGAFTNAQNLADDNTSNYYGIYQTAAKTGADTAATTATATNTFGILGTASNTSTTIDAEITRNTYGGYFSATGNTSSTTNTYGIYATAASGDTNYGLYVGGGNTYLGTTAYGASLSDCDTAASSKLLWSDTGVFSCGTDTGSSGIAWSALTNPTTSLSLTFDDAEVNTFTVSSDTEDFWTYTASSITTGSLLVGTGPTSTGVTDHFIKLSSDVGSGGSILNLNPDFSGSAVTGYGAYISGTDATTAANIDYGLYTTLAASGNLAANTAGTYYGIYGNVAKTGTDTANTSNTTTTVIGTTGIGSNTATTDDAEIIRLTYGGYFSATGNTSSVTNTYGIYTTAASADNNYALYSTGANPMNVFLATASTTSTGVIDIDVTASSNLSTGTSGINLNFTGNNIGDSVTQYGIYSNFTGSGVGNIQYGIFNKFTSNRAGSGNTQYGLYNDFIGSCTSSCADNYFGEINQLVDSSDGVGSLVFGYYGNTSSSGGSLKQVYGLYNIVTSTSSSINTYGITSIVTGAPTVNYGAYISVSGSSQDYGIYSAAGNALFALAADEKVYINGTTTTNTGTAGTLDVDTTNATNASSGINNAFTDTSTTSTTTYGIYNGWASTNATSAVITQNGYGIYSVLSRTGAVDSAVTLAYYASYNSATQTGATDTGTKLTYGGYFTAAGSASGTSTTYGIYGTASGADTNYGLFINAGSVKIPLDCSAGDQYVTAGSGGVLACATDDGGAWNAIGAPTGTLTLTFDDAELNAFTVSSDTEDFWTFTASSITTGSLLVGTGPTSTGVTDHFVKLSSDVGSGGSVLNLNPDFSGSAVTGYGAYIAGTDATTVANVDYALYSELAASGNLAANTAGTYYGIYGNVAKTGTDTANTSNTTTTVIGTTGIGSNTALTDDAEIIRETFGAYFSGVGTTNSTSRVYGSYNLASTGDITIGVEAFNNHIALGVSADVYGFYASTTGTSNLNSSVTKNVYGIYSTVTGTTNAANPTLKSFGGYFSAAGNTTGTNTVYGIYVTETAGDTTYAAYFANAAAGRIYVDSIANDSTSTTGVIDIDVDTTTTNNYGISLDYEDASTTGINTYGTYNTWVNSQVVTGTAANGFGTYNSVTKTGADTSAAATSLYGSYVTASNTGSTDAGTKNTYGGFFSATGDGSGTTTTYGIYATAASADTNYALYVTGTTSAIAYFDGVDTYVNMNGTNTTNVLCASTDYDVGTDAEVQIVPCTTDAVDYAEFFPTANEVNFGDVVVVGSEVVNPVPDADRPLPDTQLIKSSQPYHDNIIGIASDNFSELNTTGEHRFAPEDHPLPIALSGRVPVKVTDENGPIQAGDLLTTSSTPGVAMKGDPIKGSTFAKALAGFSGPGVGEILAFIQLDNRPDLETALANLNLETLSVNGGVFTVDTSGNLNTQGDTIIEGSLTVAGSQFTVDSLGNVQAQDITAQNITAASLDVAGDITVGGKIQTSQIEALPGQDIAVKLSDSAGISDFTIVNANSELLLKIDSLGNQTLYGQGGQGASLSLIGDGAVLSIAKGYICVNDSGTCSITNPQAGTIYADNFSTAETADLAESFPSQDASIEAGDLVAVDPNNKESIELSKAPYQPTLLGIISTEPGVTLNVNQENGKALALAGRVPAKVSLENGPIKAGDFITSSSSPGVGMKATRSGRTIGVALEDFSACAGSDPDGGCSSTIIVFVEPGWYLGGLADNGSFETRSDLADAQARSDLVQLSNDVTNTDGTLTNSQQPTRQSFMEEGSAASSQQSADKIRQLVEDEVKRQLSTLTSDQGIRTTAVESSPTTIDSPIPEATDSALALSGVEGEATDSANLAQEADETLDKITELLATTNLSIDTLKVNGTTQLAQTQLAGTFSQDGTFIIDYGRQINVLGSTLFLQNDPLAGDELGILVDVGGGAATIDKEGNLTIRGQLTADSIQTKELVIDSSDPNAKTVGSNQIPANQRQVTIFTTALKSEAKILLTPTTQTGGKSLYIANKSEFEGFTVALDGSQVSNTIKFDWLIVNTNSVSQAN